MKAAVLTKPSLDPGQAFTIAEMSNPVAAKGEIVIRLHAASINPLDTLMRQGYGESLFKWLRPRGPLVLGLDGAGVVESVGQGVARFKPGDRVMAASMPFRSGFYAEAVAVPSEWASPIPASISLDTAAALPYAGLTARQVLRAARLDARTAKGQRVLVHGGSGGIGSMLVQILHSWGAWVASTCSTGNVDFVRGLGADQVVDYRKEDFAQVLSGLDVVVNTITPKEPKLVEGPHLSVLRRGGHFVSLISPTLELAGRLGAPLGLLASAGWTGGARAYWGVAAGKHHHWVYFRPSGEMLSEMAHWVANGVFQPVLGGRFQLEDVASAHRSVELGPAHGKALLLPPGAAARSERRKPA